MAWMGFECTRVNRQKGAPWTAFKAHPRAAMDPTAHFSAETAPTVEPKP